MVVRKKKSDGGNSGGGSRESCGSRDKNEVKEETVEVGKKFRGKGKNRHNK